jgi:hypothetical protein
MKKRLNIFLLAFPLCPVFQIQAQEKPNLVFIMADQWRGDALGCLGKEPVKTPCLDQLAREGVNFTNAVSSYPVSSPARGMLMTGMYPHKNKVTGNCNSANAPYGVELPQDARCWSDILKANGYQTGYIGKWHLDAPYEPYIDTYNNHDSFCRLVSDPAFHHGLSATNTGRSTNIQPCFRSPLRKRKQPHCPTLLLHTVIQSGNRLPGITHRHTYVYYPYNRWKGR